MTASERRPDVARTIRARVVGGRSEGPTMMDIAREAGVSQSTVSRVLNDVASPVPIAPGTRERVLAAAARLEYTPNPFARALRGASTGLIGAIVRDITDPFWMAAIDALSSAVMARGFNVVLGHAHASAREAKALKAVLETRHCDGIVVLGNMQDQPRLIEDLQRSRVPVVALWQGSRIRGIPAVTVDNAAGIRALLAHLRELGHTRIAFIEGRPIGDHHDRRVAFAGMMDAEGVAVPRHHIRTATNSPAGGSEALQALFALQERPTAVIAASDQLAIGCLHAASELGLRVPDDLSITGFDDLPIAAYTVPALTTVRMPVAEMIDAAVSLVLDPPPAEGVTVALPLVHQPELVVRSSTGPAPRGGGRTARAPSRLEEPS